MIAIRTKVSADIGIGHIVRMQHLSKEFQSLGKDVVFILDYPIDNISPYIQSANVIYLSDKKIKYPQAEDAKKVISLLKNMTIEMIILDCYELSIEWENIIKDEAYKLAVVDDILRKHNCDYIIDQKYAKENTAAQYDKLVPNKCIKLLGPQYAILSSDYQNNKINKSKSFNILFSLGGGGDLNIIRKIISKLANKKIVLQVVIGPLSRGKKEIKELAEKHKSVQLIENAPTLYPYYKEASLFIGTLGTSFYECRALKIPSITFSTAKNHEKNNKELSYLEDYGHYLHLNLNELQVTDSMVSLILLISEKIKRIRALSNKAIINVDGFGANRIASILCGYEKAIELLNNCGDIFAWAPSLRGWLKDPDYVFWLGAGGLIFGSPK